MLTGGKNNSMESLRIPVEGSFGDLRTDVGAVLEINLEQNKQALREFLSLEDESTDDGSEQDVEYAEDQEYSQDQPY